jgi:crossover junction endodeoxyribonuclease RuvC
MIILGVDPGTLITGYGVIKHSANKTRVLEAGVVKNGTTKALPYRLKAIFAKLVDVIEKYRPDEFAIETSFYSKNAQSAMKLGHARGVALLAAVNRDIPTSEYSPREVKKAVVGNGAASKEQVRFMVRNLLKLRASPVFYDSSDALAVALCHLHRITSGPSGRNWFKDWKSFVETHPERIVRRPRG